VALMPLKRCIMICTPRKSWFLVASWNRLPAGRSCFSVPATKPQLVINIDNRPECSGRRTQFLFRLKEFADMTGLCVRLVYYTPYHSKYNSIERYWAGLEKSWNGYLLDTVETVLKRAGNFFWKGVRAVTRLLDAPYEKGVKISGNEKSDIEQRLQRSPVLHWWDITIYPKMVNL